MNTAHAIRTDSSTVLWSIVVAAVLCACAADHSSSDRGRQASHIPGPEQREEVRSPAVAAESRERGGSAGRIKPEDAFTKGIQSVMGHIDLFDPKWQVSFRRTETGNWFMTIARFPTPGVTEVKILIRDNGEVMVLPGL